MRMQAIETDFGLDLLRRAPIQQSCVLSPLSVMFALAMVQVGSKGNTKMQISNKILDGASDETLLSHLSKLSADIAKAKKGVQTKIANGFFLDELYDDNLNKSYVEKIRKHFSAKVATLDFSDAVTSAKEINDFVSNSTNGKIKKLVNRNTIKDAFFVITNAIYFHGIWQDKFSKNATAKGDFFTAENKSKELDFMKASKEKRMYAEDEDLQLLSLNYMDRSYALNIILPKKKFGLQPLLAKMTGTKLQNLLRRLENKTITISLPKIKLETNFKLKEALMAMGITDMFGWQADLSQITDQYALYVSDAAHKAVFEMDEESTTAAAATAFRGSYKSLVRKLNFIADHPFLLLLTKSRHPLFIGKFTGN
ncbi:unnamed protein product [Cylicocyclus nassatus]|uniref:Serpin domain-containing protein n=1 Tax=Cylicocyclus nassatus TaxID=53992 RepID=A0AA36GI43_CYLNA|nr:unnamed protein product [Cylicocyclus nassatus]